MRFLGFCFLLAVWAPLGQAENFRVGLSVWSGYPSSVAGFKAGLAEEGIVEGRNVVFIAGESGADKALQEKIAKEFKVKQLDLIYSLTTPGTLIVKQVMGETTPIVFSIVTYPADSGIIESFDYSGNNLVGTSNFVETKQYIGLLELMLPSVKNIAIFHRDGEPNSTTQAVNLYRQLKRLGKNVSIKKPVDIESTVALARSLVGRVDLFVTTTDTLMQSGAEEALIAISLKHKIPILSSNKKGIEKGATFGPVADFYILGEMAGKKAAKILKGEAEPRQLESELMSPPLYLVNKTSLLRLGIELSPEAREKISWVSTPL